MQATKTETLNESRIVRVETVIDHINYRLDNIDKRFDELKLDTNKRFDDVKDDIKTFKSDTNKRFDEVKSEIKDVRTEISGVRTEGKTHFRWIMGFLFVAIICPFIQVGMPFIHKG